MEEPNALKKKNGQKPFFFSPCFLLCFFTSAYRKTNARKHEIFNIGFH